MKNDKEKNRIIPHLWANIDFEKLREDHYKEEIENPNNYSFWYPKVKDCGIKMVNSWIFKFSFEEWKTLESIEEVDSRENALIFLKEKIEGNKEIKKGRLYNIKNGAFSNKFNANDCFSNYYDIPRKFLNIQYAGMCYDADGTSEMVIREIIPYDEDKTPTIYNGLPLRPEFRAFVDFDTNKVLYIVNYWNYDYCYNHLCKTDKIIFDYMKKTLNREFENNKNNVVKLIKENLIEYNRKNENKLIGIWSVDIMKSDNDYYLIDMALGHQSAYYDYEKIRKEKMKNERKR